MMSQDPTLEPFTVSIPPDTIDDLRARLRATRWPQGVTDSGGIPLSEMRPLVEYWLHEFDWKRQEEELNRFAHYRATVDGLRVHFIHARCGRTEALPLLMLHGWPGSFVEMLEVIPRLQASFHVVVPSLPGYGFSDGSYAPFVEGDMKPEEEAFLRDGNEWIDQSYAYGRIQGTRPLTLGYAPGDSPAGLAAWIAEKFREWADPSSKIPIDRLLTNVTLYWVTNSIASSMRLYLESSRTPLRLAQGQRVEVPARSRDFLMSCRARRDRGSSAGTTSSAGRRCPAAGISRRWRRRSCWRGMSKTF